MTEETILSGSALDDALDQAADGGQAGPDDYCERCRGPCPPRYQEILDWSDYLERLAVQLETDDLAWADAVADIIMEGYNSEIARVGIHDYRDPGRPSANAAAMQQHLEGELPENFFADDLSRYFLDFGIAETRSVIVETIRNKAHNSRLVAAQAIEYAEGRPDFYGTEGGSGSVQLFAYLCSKDPELITQGVWNALYHMGLIDYATWEEASFEALADFEFRAALAMAVATGGVSLVRGASSIARRLFRSGVPGALRFGRNQLRRLQMLAQRQLALLPFRRTIRVYRVEGGGNAFFRVTADGRVAVMEYCSSTVVCGTGPSLILRAAKAMCALRTAVLSALKFRAVSYVNWIEPLSPKKHWH
ncbi:hypothetical protein [Yoonia sp. 2307UL14-13]|uniref:hypothetical protein n=1 Tax=Yoonia sp. 2307UL14-13 TaxID=3126506 RepID=UPI0030AB3122